MKLNEYIKKNNINITEFAKLIGVKRNSVHRYKRGRPPKEVVMNKIIHYTKGAVQPNDFFDSSKSKIN